MTELFAPLSRIRLLADARDGSALTEGLDGAVVSTTTVVPGADVAGTWMLEATPDDAPEWLDRPGTVWVADGLPAALAARERWPDLAWLPRMTPRRAVVRYRMAARYPGEGFRVYAPDTQALTGYEIDDGARSLSACLRDAWDHGFRTVWLHDSSAAEDANGPDLNILERARNIFDGQLVLSTDVRSVADLERSADEQSLVAMIVPAALLTEQDTGAMIAALTPAPPSPPEPDANPFLQGEVA